MLWGKKTDTTHPFKIAAVVVLGKKTHNASVQDSEKKREPAKK